MFLPAEDAVKFSLKLFKKNYSAKKEITPYEKNVDDACRYHLAYGMC
jgi:hypothetical protein